VNRNKLKKTYIKTIDKSMEKLLQNFSSLNLNNQTSNIVKIQKVFKGCLLRKKRLPQIMYDMAAHLKSQSFKFHKDNADGRINSCTDEDNIVKVLVDKYDKRIYTPTIRMWYDILAFDYRYGWIPINIKSTTTETCDNTGNLAMCVYAYTDELLDLKKNYRNGPMSKILYEKLENKKYNYNDKKDYYFIVMNKEKPSEVIVNSVKGLSYLTPNLNNLPFQVKWKNNKEFKYNTIDKSIKQFVDCIKRPQPSWNETFLQKMRSFNV
tara:strand:- start:1331 stop:2125 length:795 start_codon:yes stop_codon:yes gene_type:complete